MAVGEKEGKEKIPKKFLFIFGFFQKYKKKFLRPVSARTFFFFFFFFFFLFLSLSLFEHLDRDQ